MKPVNAKKTISVNPLQFTLTFFFFKNEITYILKTGVNPFTVYTFNIKSTF